MGWLDDLLGYRDARDEGIAVTRRTALNFTGAGVVVTDDPATSATQVAISGSAGSVYNTVKDEGTALTQRSVLNFVGGGVVAADVGGETRVTISGLSQSLSSVLTVGNTTGTNDIDVTAARNIDFQGEVSIQRQGVAAFSTVSATSQRYDTGAGGLFTWRANSVSVAILDATGLDLVSGALVTAGDITTTSNLFLGTTQQFSLGVVPVIRQASATGSGATGALFTVQAQDVTGAGTTITGGALTIRAGNAESGTATNRQGGLLTLAGGTGGTGTGDPGAVALLSGTQEVCRAVLVGTAQALAFAAEGGTEIAIAYLARTVAGAGKTFAVRGQEASGANPGGAMIIEPGRGGAAGQNGGALQLRAGERGGAGGLGEIILEGNAGALTFARFRDDNGVAKFGVFTATPVARAPAYTVTNLTIDRSYDADTVTVAELADIVGTLLSDLRDYGWVQ